MAIKGTLEGDRLRLDVDNGDLEKLNQVIEKWNFRDYQSLMRFAISIMIVTEDNTLGIKSNGNIQPITPAREYLK